MRARLFLVVLTGASLAAGEAEASGIENAGTAVAVSLPLLAGALTIHRDDWMGLAQLTADTGATVGTALLLKQFVREQRPDKSDFKSFPSDTAALAFAPAQFIWDRYGWRAGIPAYAAAVFVGYSRVDAKQHHWYDVAASAGLAFGMSKIFTTRYRSGNLSYGAVASPDAVYASLNYRW